ncbi:MAG: carboxymuconolactone decarboxylase family protein [Gammaproteobacteria bacterium]|nr:MAG: carboxymuconolactone decarboxylase family protein [Gammaproteobacteria bacterium]UTW42458.1 carboxymuconolactone decarboxylase family protein [bacterium SCSIO 12844]
MRLEYYALSKDLFNDLIEVKNKVQQCGLDKKLIELMYLRISQINGCQYCIKVHSADLTKQGESQQRIDAVNNWQDSSLFTNQEKTAFAWAESLTNIKETQADDHYYQPLKAYFSDKEISDLTFAVALMNAFNRLAIALGH